MTSTCCPACAAYVKAVQQAIERAGQEYHEEMQEIRQTEQRGARVTIPSGSVTYNQLIQQDRLTTNALREAP